jgi:hypothetical protein
MVDNQGNKVIEVTDRSYDRQIAQVALNLRKADFDEVFASTGESPHYAIQEGWDFSLRRWIVLDKNDVPVAVLGVRPQHTFSDIGIPWLLGTDGLSKMSKFFLKASKPILEEMKKGFSSLSNYVDARYIKAVRWLRWLGFNIEPAKPFGVKQELFHRISMELK